MSKICRTFAPKFGKVMKKIYNQPEIEIAEVQSIYAIMDGSLLPGAPVNPTDPPAWGD